MEIIWTDFAINNFKDIFNYYSLKVNRKIANKIRKQILKTTSQLKNNPESGQIEFNLKNRLNQEYRYLVSGNYKIIYKVSENNIVINDIFDTRQNPLKMNNETLKD